MQGADSKFDNLFRNLLIIILVVLLIGSTIAAIWFRENIYEPKNNFTELYFLEPDLLPQLVELDGSYDYSFEIINNERENKTYRYTTSLELYRVYNQTDARYNCISQLRNKIFLDWTNESNGFTVFSESGDFNEIQNLVVFPSDDKFIEWEKYTLDFNFGRPVGKGKLAIFFTDKFNVKYKVMVDTSLNKVYFNDEEMADFAIKDENNNLMLIANNNSISLILNLQTVFKVNVSDTTGGNFGLESQDGYFSIQKFRVYRDTPIVIPDTDTIREYDVNVNIVNRKRIELLDKRSKSVRLIRDNQEYDDSVDCEEFPFYCEYFDLANDITFNLEGLGLKEAIKRIPIFGQVNYLLYPADVNRSTIDWTDFNLSFSHTQFEESSLGHVILSFGEKWGIMITRNNTYYMRSYDNKTVIDEIRNPMQAQNIMSHIEVQVNPANVSFFINNNSVFVKDTPKDYTETNVEVYVKNKFVTINSVTVTNLDSRCDDPYNFVFCELSLESGVPKRRRVQSEPDYTISSLDHGTDEDEINIASDFENVDIEEELFSYPIYNSFITDQRYIFDRPYYEIVNASNFTVEYSYEALDGSRIMELGILDLNGSESFSVYIVEREDSLVIYDGQLLFTKAKFINMSNRHHIRLKFEEGSATIRFDNKDLFVKEKTDIDTGYLFIGQKNTYAEIFNAFITIDGLRRPLKIRADPCDLKPIYNIETENNLNLSSTAKKRISRNFQIGHEFDYGIVSVKLYGSSGTNETNPLEIHFWVVKDV